MGIYGEDWASYQGDSPEIAGDVSFVFTKVTQGLTYVNPYWPVQRSVVKGANRPWGAYHYPDMRNDPVVEADHFLSQVLWVPGDMIALDWEGYDPGNAGVQLADQRAYKDAWLHHVQQRMPGHRVGLYCDVNYWTRIDESGYCGDFLWIATVGLPAGDPGVQHPWTFHQIGTRPMAGDASIEVDVDYAAFGSVGELHDWALSVTQPPPTPTPTPTPTPALLTGEVDMTPFEIPANVTTDIPVEPAGTVQQPQGGARNAGIWLGLAPQGSDGTLSVMLRRNGTWTTEANAVAVTVEGPKYVITLPTDGSVDKIRVRPTVPLLAYVVGRQVA